MSLNFAAFAKWMHSPEKRYERVLGKLVALGNPFFQIESLYRFNAKFFPRWEPRYLVYEGALGLPRAGIAAMWAEGQLPKPTLRPPWRRAASARRDASDPNRPLTFPVPSTGSSHPRIGDESIASSATTRLPPCRYIPAPAAPCRET